MAFAGYGFVRPYDVSSDGQKFLIWRAIDDSGDAPITVVLNWWAALKKK